MKIFILIIIIIVAILALILIIFLTRKVVKRITYFDVQNAWLAQEFSRCNVITFGSKGSGKDLIFSHAIGLRNDVHYSNMPYNALSEVIRVEDMALGDNTYLDCIHDTITKIATTFEDGKDIYISDGGIYLPALLRDSTLDELYPSMPLFYALQRQIYNSNSHFNVQALNRLWIKIREQADCYIRAINTENKGDYLIVTAISYDQYESAERGLLPVNDKQYISTHGKIVERKFKIKISDIEYNTRYFRDVFLKYNNDTFLDEVIKYVK